MPLDRSVGNYFDSTKGHLLRVARWVGPASYVAGGEDVSPAVFGLGKIIAIQPVLITDGTTTRLGVWNPVTQKLQFIVPNTNVEVAGAVNLSAFVGSIVVWGN
jgi:hypothetical protein